MRFTRRHYKLCTIFHVRGILSYLCADLVDLLRVLPQFGRQLVVVTDLELQQRNHDVNTCVVMDNAEEQRRAWA